VVPSEERGARRAGWGERSWLVLDIGRAPQAPAGAREEGVQLPSSVRRQWACSSSWAWRPTFDWKACYGSAVQRVIGRYPLQPGTNVPRPAPRYNKLAGSLRQLAHRLSLLPSADPFRHAKEADLLSKLYDMGLLNLENKLSDVENKVTVSGFCRRRLAVVVCRMRMAETVGTVRPPPLLSSPLFGVRESLDREHFD
jgi:hypothetical protein